MDWLTENKIPVGKVAGTAFDWLESNGAFFFDALSDALEAMIDGFLWLLQRPIRWSSSRCLWR
jgi:glycine betaine/proline transport system permease protein